MAANIDPLAILLGAVERCEELEYMDRRLSVGDTGAARPAFSICMATYNGAEHVAEQLRSILREMKPLDELIVVDDHSSDATVPIVKGIFAQSSLTHLELVELEYNGGHRAAFVRAISVARNPLIALSDQDDVWYPGRLDSLAQNLADTSADLCFGSLETFGQNPSSRSDETHELRNTSRRLKGRGGLAIVLLSEPLAKGRLTFFGSACAFQKDAIDVSIPVTTESHEYWLIAQALAQRGVSFSPDTVTFRRIHANNLTQRRSLGPRIAAHMHTYRAMTRIFRLARIRGV